MKKCVLTVAALLLSACADHTGPQLFDAGAAPASLSQWQLMQVNSDNKKLMLNPAVLAYDLATPLFSDYALKLRTLWLPQGTHARYTTEGSLDFPVGTVISKTFYYPRTQAEPENLRAVQWTQDLQSGFDGQSLDLREVILIETRLLVHQPDGWQALPYVWNDEQTDATLQIVGNIKRLTLHRDNHKQAFAYVVPNRNECASCHQPDQNVDTLSPVGPSARNLNRLADFYPGGAGNQLEVLAARAWLEGLPEPHKRPAAARWDPDQPLTEAHNLEARARTYLAVNCAHCHQRGGSGDTSGLFLDAAENDATRLGVCKPPVAAGRGTGGHRFSIVPGQPQQSILSYRIFSDETGVLMPETGRSLVHQEGLDLINAWITHMPGDCE